MRVLVCGGRDYGTTTLPDGVVIPDEQQIRRLNQILERAHEEYQQRRSILDRPDAYTAQSFVLINGGAKGADRLAEEWGTAKPGVVVNTYYADWKKHKRAAGPIRNVEMLKDSRPNCVIAFPGGNGTAHMVKIAKKAGVPVMEVT